jgi:hypothetical protein
MVNTVKSVPTYCSSKILWKEMRDLGQFGYGRSDELWRYRVDITIRPIYVAVERLPLLPCITAVPYSHNSDIGGFMPTSNTIIGYHFNFLGDGM